MEKMMHVKLNSIDMVKEFVNGLVKYDGVFDAISDHYSIDAKSFLGILTLDLSNPFQLKVLTDDREAIDFLKTYQTDK